MKWFNWLHIQGHTMVLDIGWKNSTRPANWYRCSHLVMCPNWYQLFGAVLMKLIHQNVRLEETRWTMVVDDHVCRQKWPFLLVLEMNYNCFASIYWLKIVIWIDCLLGYVVVVLPSIAGRENFDGIGSDKVVFWWLGGGGSTRGSKSPLECYSNFSHEQRRREI